MRLALRAAAWPQRAAVTAPRAGSTAGRRRRAACAAGDAGGGAHEYYMVDYTYLSVADGLLEKRAPHREGHLAAAERASAAGHLLLGGASLDAAHDDAKVRHRPPLRESRRPRARARICRAAQLSVAGGCSRHSRGDSTLAPNAHEALTRIARPPPRRTLRSACRAASAPSSTTSSRATRTCETASLRTTRCASGASSWGAPTRLPTSERAPLTSRRGARVCPLARQRRFLHPWNVSPILYKYMAASARARGCVRLHARVRGAVRNERRGQQRIAARSGRGYRAL